MGINVAKELTVLKGKTVAELRQRYAEVFGEQTRVAHKDLLVKRIIWRMQALEQGDLSERARQRAEELANDADLRMYPPKAGLMADAPDRTVTRTTNISTKQRLPMPNSVLTREYKGKIISVTVLEKGFEYEGEKYRSLSAVAKKVTGSHWNGFLFFGLVGKEAGK